MFEALVISFFAAPLVYALYGWFESGRKRNRKLKEVQKRIAAKEAEKD